MLSNVSPRASPAWRVSPQHDQSSYDTGQTDRHRAEGLSRGM